MRARPYVLFWLAGDFKFAVAVLCLRLVLTLGAAMTSKAVSESTTYPSSGSSNGTEEQEIVVNAEVVDASYTSNRKIIKVSRPDRKWCGTGGGCTSCFWLITFVSNVVFMVLFGDLCAKYDNLRRLDTDELQPVDAVVLPAKNRFSNQGHSEPEGGEVAGMLSRNLD